MATLPTNSIEASGDSEAQADADLTVADAPSVDAPPDLAHVDQHDWDEARRRLKLIEPLLQGMICPSSTVTAQAQAGGVVTTTIYRWAQKYRASGLLSSLLPTHPSVVSRKFAE